jgi:aminoglycoside phosphotransferase (APT) family kinase protein
LTDVYADAIPDLVRAAVGVADVSSVRRVAGGASRETWQVVTDGVDAPQLIVRVEAHGSARPGALTLAQEALVMRAAERVGVATPPVLLYDDRLLGRPAIVMPLVPGESRGTRIVRRPELANARNLLPSQMAAALAAIHSIDPVDVPFLPRRENAETVLRLLLDELLAMPGLHPALEWMLRELLDRPLPNPPPVVCHGDVRVGNVLVTPHAGLTAVLDWELAHIGDPLEDLTWPLVRQWRFGNDSLRLGGIGEVEGYFRTYADLTRRRFTGSEMLMWETIGNLKWALGCLSQARRHLDGFDRSIEYAILGRLTCEPTFEALWLSRQLPAKGASR